MSLTSFTCKNSDFVVCSRDGTCFHVQHQALQNSQVFRDMFVCCEGGTSNEVLELDEPAHVLSALLHLLHYGLEPPLELNPTKTDQSTKDNDLSVKERFLPQIPSYDTKTVIPLPVLQPMLFDLVDKYALNLSIFQTLCAHLLAHAPLHPLRVYGFASSLEPIHQRRRPRPSSQSQGGEPYNTGYFGIEAEREMEKYMRKVASKASQFLEPIGNYTMEEVLDTIPNVKALHRVVQLQHLRVNALRKVLSESDIFPQGYGACPFHQESTMECWERQRKALAGKIDSETDVGGEMELFVDTLKDCKVCYKAGVAAVEMLAYKCFRLPKKIDYLPEIF